MDWLIHKENTELKRVNGFSEKYIIFEEMGPK